MKRLKIVNRSTGAAGEYCGLSANLYSGCPHECVYCYVPLVRRMSRAAFHERAYPRTDALKKLEADARALEAAGEPGPVLMSFTTDPYNPAEPEERLTRAAILTLNRHSVPVVILTKGGARSFDDIPLLAPYAENEYAASISIWDDQIAKRWEPFAAPPSERAAGLRLAHDAGLYTWVSIEPVLSILTAQEVILRTQDFVDEFRVGKLNYNRFARKIDWREALEKIEVALLRSGRRYMIKKELEKFRAGAAPTPKAGL